MTHSVDYRSGHAPLTRVVRLLLRVAELDTAYRGRYLRRSEALLRRDLSPSERARLKQLQRRLEQTGGEAEEALGRSEWDRVTHLAERAEELQTELVPRSELLLLWDALEIEVPVRLSPFSAALQGLTTHPASDLVMLQKEIVADFAQLEEEDREQREFYLSRRRHFEQLAIVGEGNDPNAPFNDSALVQQDLHAAVQSRDWRRAEKLARALAAQSRPGRVAAARRVDTELLSRLRDQLPAAVIEAAARLELVPVSLPDAVELRQYVSSLGGGSPRIPDTALSPGARRVAAETGGHPSSGGLDAGLRETLDLLILHPFVTSAGVAYVPAFVPETMLVETFPEEESEAGSPLLDALGIPSRRNSSRVSIERAIQRHEDGILQSLGLDVADFALVCIPFDAYMRLAPEQRWGRQQLWTHFDGYQVARGLQLRALVGGDLRYGGPADLCSVGNDYAEPNMVVRFAVIRRQRLLL